MCKINVKCKAGNISGSVKQGINFFYGIPYAKPLTKKTQWQPPEKLDAEILFEATKRGLSSPQTIYQESFLTDLNMPDQSID